jgi:sarcosine dehydrogenase
VDVTELYSTLSLMGPKSRQVLERATTADFSTTAFPFGHVRELVIAGQQVHCARITYVGELGYELHVPVAGATAVFRALDAAGAGHDLKLCGYRAIESLRLEKGYRAWGSDITPNDTPFEAGLGFLIKLKTEFNFKGKDALLKMNNAPLVKLLTGFVTERDDVVLVGRETILRDGKFAGYLTSGGYGYTIGKPIGYGYVRNANGVDVDYVMNGSYELVVANEPVKATPFFGALYDSKSERVKR